MALFGRRKNAEESRVDPVLVASIQNTVSSEIFQDILKENGIPCICRQEGAGCYIKIITGGLLVVDNIYVDEKNLERAKELYDAYLGTEVFEVEE